MAIQPLGATAPSTTANFLCSAAAAAAVAIVAGVAVAGVAAEAAVLSRVGSLEQSSGGIGERWAEGVVDEWKSYPTCGL